MVESSTELISPEPTGYKIVWTARNEDFLPPLGVPDFIRGHSGKHPLSEGI
jgi:hypothetical protein